MKCNSAHAAAPARQPQTRGLKFGLGLGVLLAPLFAWALGPATAAQARYQQERAVCLRGQSNQERGTCLREAQAALAEARHGGLDGDATSYARNASQRCERLPDEQRPDCIARMHGQGTVSGSSAAGGLYRELRSPVPASAASAP